MTGDNGLRDAVADALVKHGLFQTKHHGGGRWTWHCMCFEAFDSREAHAAHQAEQTAALPAIREALAAVAQRDAALALAEKWIAWDDEADPVMRSWDGWVLRRVLAPPTSPEEPT